VEFKEKGFYSSSFRPPNVNLIFCFLDHRVGFDRVFGETRKNSKWRRSNMNQLTATIIITGLTLLAASAVWSNGGESSKKEHNHAALEAGQDQGHKSSAIEAISKSCVTTSHQDCQAIAAIADQLYQAMRSGHCQHRNPGSAAHEWRLASGSRSLVIKSMTEISLTRINRAIAKLRNTSTQPTVMEAGRLPVTLTSLKPTL